MSGATLEIRCRDVAGTVVVVPRGVLTLDNYGELRDMLLKVGSAEPRAVVVDLGDVTISHRITVALFPRVAEQLDRWPGVPLLVAAPTEEHRALLDRIGVSRYVPVLAAVAPAVGSVAEAPPRQVVRRALSDDASGLAHARQFVHDVCRQWDIARGHLAGLIANELVENTLVHTAYAPSLRLELRRGALSIAVFDDDPVRPEPYGSGATTEPRRGLRLLARLTNAWGSAPTLSGGKVVWAVLRVAPAGLPRR